MVKTTIRAGVCGFSTTVLARSDDEQNVTLSIESDCEKIRGVAERLTEPIDAYQEIGAGFGGAVYKVVLAGLKGCCAGCVVPSGIFKSVQVAGRVALPAPITIDIERVEQG
ncbi:MAG: hypothetical protein NTU62_01245 [Spirochaetes bacterium]|nr:hypothetical protein [Spirochaetota bacterium]